MANDRPLVYGMAPLRHRTAAGSRNGGAFGLPWGDRHTARSSSTLARALTSSRLIMCTANVFDVSMFTELDGLANDWLRNRSQSSWLLARNAAPTAMIERIDSPPRQGGASPGCIVPQPALDPSPSHRAHHARDYL